MNKPEDLAEFVGGEGLILESASHVVECMSKIIKAIQNIHEPAERIRTILEIACCVFQAEWAGIINVDLSEGVWSPIYWYAPDRGYMCETPLQECEYSEIFSNWVEALKKRKMMFHVDLKALKTEFPRECEYYQKMGARRIMAAPFGRDSDGFLIVKNPGHTEHSSLLEVMGYVAASELDVIQRENADRYAVRPAEIQNDNDIYIRQFGGLEIITSYGTIASGEFGNNLQSRLIAYLTMLKGKSAAPRRIAEALYAGKTVRKGKEREELVKNIRKIVCKAKGQLKPLFRENLFITTDNAGYCLNYSTYNIRTETEEFDELLEAANEHAERETRLEKLTSAVQMYKGNLFENCQFEPWAYSPVLEYWEKYKEAVYTLCMLYAEIQDWENVNRYARMALEHAPKEFFIYYWLLMSEQRSHDETVSEEILQMAWRKLDPDSWNLLVAKIEHDFKGDHWHRCRNLIGRMAAN